MLDFEKMAADVVTAAQGFVTRAVAGMGKRIDDLTIRQNTLEQLGGSIPETLDRMVKAAVSELPAPANGKDADPLTVMALVDQRVALAVAAIPIAKDGAPGTSVYQIACLGGFKGTEVEWLESLRGKSGESIKGDPGKDADPVDVAAIIADVVKQIPIPQAGKDAPPVDIAAIVAEVTAKIPAPKQGEPGKDGDVDLGVLTDMVTASVRVAVDGLPPPKDGESIKGDPGKDADPVDVAAIVAEVKASIPVPEAGKDADPEAVRIIVADEVAKSVAALPLAKQGEPGKNADPVDPSVIAAMVAELLPSMVEKARGMLSEQMQALIATIPKPKDGDPGKSFTIDDLRPMFEAEQAKWALEFERRAADVLQHAIDKMPVPKDGRNALELEDLNFSLGDDGRTLAVKFARGELVKEWQVTFAVPLDCGVYRPESHYAKGDGVTFGGSWWIAQKDAPQGKPDSGNGDWRLSVKKGRDGKDGGVLGPPMPREPVRVQ
jgi:hypothetical protein